MRKAVHLILLLQLALGSVHGNEERKYPHVAETFNWWYPYHTDGEIPNGFNVTCEAIRVYRAKQYHVKELKDSTWAPALNELLGRHEYLGSWSGMDRGGDERDFIIMEYKDVPKAVKEWVREQHQKEMRDETRKDWLFGIFEKPEPASDGKPAKPPKWVDEKDATKADTTGDGFVKLPDDKNKVLMFAPAAIHDILPLWGADGTSCRESFTDLSKYSYHMNDDGVIAWPLENSVPDQNNDITFKIRVTLLHETEETKEKRKMWEKVHIAARRNYRKYEREERQAAKERMERGEDDREKDEL